LKENMRACSICGSLHPVEVLTEFDDHYLCRDCLHTETTLCERCGERVWADDNAGDGNTPLCQRCYDNYYTSCVDCGRIIHNDDAYYIDEKNWEELLKFSRRTHKQLKQWATRYGLKEHPKDILKCAKGDRERYTCVNLTNYHTIEFRIFRGTLKLNTLLATLQLIDRICDVALYLSDEELKDMSWSTFVAGCTQPELVQYLKERRLYVNEPVVAEAEV